MFSSPVCYNIPMLLGYHVSAAGGLQQAFANAAELDSTAIQIFVASPQSWATALPTPSKNWEISGAGSKTKNALVFVWTLVICLCPALIFGRKNKLMICSPNLIN